MKTYNTKHPFFNIERSNHWAHSLSWSFPYDKKTLPGCCTCVRLHPVDMKDRHGPKQFEAFAFCANCQGEGTMPISLGELK